MLELLLLLLSLLFLNNLQHLFFFFFPGRTPAPKAALPCHPPFCCRCAAGYPPASLLSYLPCLPCLFCYHGKFRNRGIQAACLVVPTRSLRAGISRSFRPRDRLRHCPCFRSRCRYSRRHAQAGLRGIPFPGTDRRHLLTYMYEKTGEQPYNAVEITDLCAISA